MTTAGSATVASRKLRLISWVTIVAQLVFVISWLIAAAWQGPRYSVAAHSISDMYAVTAPSAWFLIAVFTAAGVLTVLFTIFAVLPTFRRDGWAAILGTVLLGLSIFALGDVLTPFERLACRLADAGCSPADQVANAGGALDSSYSTAGVAAFIAAAIFLSFSMAKFPGWKSWAWPTRGFAVVVFLCFVLDGVLSDAGLAGLFERLIALLGAAGIALLAAGILLKSRNSPVS